MAELLRCRDIGEVRRPLLSEDRERGELASEQVAVDVPIQRHERGLHVPVVDGLDGRLVRERFRRDVHIQVPLQPQGSRPVHGPLPRVGDLDEPRILLSPLHEIPEVLEIFPLKGLDLGIAYRHEHRKAPVRLCHHLEVLGPDPAAFRPLRSEQSLGHVGKLVPLRLLCRDVAPGDEPLLPGTLVHKQAYA